MASLFKINLADPSSFQRSINKVAKKIATIADLHNKMVYETTERLLSTILKNAEGIVETGVMLDSIHSQYVETGNGLLVGQIIGADYIIYIEYGTGSKGADSASPNTPEGWKWNGKDGWVYYDDLLGEFRTTHGQEPRPFIRTSVEEIRGKVNEGVSVAMYEWIAST